jgi:hypothetical protein
MKLLRRLEKNKDCWFLFIISILFFLLRFPSLFEPYWYGDEGIYQTIGLAMNQGRMLYSQIWDNKPPLLYVVYALFQADQFVIRLVSLLFGIMSVFFLYLLTKKLFQDRVISMISTSFFAVLFALPFFEGNIANAENFMLLPIVIAGFLVYTFRFQISDVAAKILTSKWQVFGAGVLLSIAFLFKIVGLFDFAAFFLFSLFLLLPKKISYVFKKSYLLSLLTQLAPLVAGFLLPLFFTFLYFALHHAFTAFIQGSFFGNIGYVGYGNTFFIPQGFLILKLLLLFLFVVVLFVFRHKLPKSALFILLWLGFSLFDAFFSQRPYTHYVLVTLPSLSLGVGLFVYLRGIYSRSLVFLLLIIITFLLLHNFYNFGYKRTFLYYQNFIQYMMGRKEIVSYQSFFDRKTPRDYALAQFIKQHTHPNDILFVWGNSAQIYALSHTLPPGKYTVAYHMTQNTASLRETAADLSRTHPRYIVLLSGMSAFPFAITSYVNVFNFNGAAIYEKTY